MAPANASAALTVAGTGSVTRRFCPELVLLSENHLRAAVREYLVHYHQERNHQGLGGQLIVPRPTSTGPDRSYAGSASVGYCAFITQMRHETSRSSFRTLRGCALLLLPSLEGFY